MPGVPDLTNAVPENVQQFLNVVVFLIMAAITAYGYFRKGPVPAEKSADFVVTAAQIADMQPVRDLAAEVRRLADETARSANYAGRTAVATEEIADLMEQDLEAEDQRRIARAELEKMMQEQNGPPVRHGNRRRWRRPKPS